MVLSRGMVALRARRLVARAAAFWSVEAFGVQGARRRRARGRVGAALGSRGRRRSTGVRAVRIEERCAFYEAAAEILVPLRR